MPARSRAAVEFAVPAGDDKHRPPFVVDERDKQFQKQYANLYWLRLVVQRRTLEQAAKQKWKDQENNPKFVRRMLDVSTGTLCYIIGTLYMDMPLKPNVLEDLARDHYIAAPPPRRKFGSAGDEVMLEDESGRIRLIGDSIKQAMGTFVTGTIVAALGFETPLGDFRVKELIFAGAPPQPQSSRAQDMDEDIKDDAGWIAIASGLNMGSTEDAADLRIAMLAEWLCGEVGGEEDSAQAAGVSRLILAGNSLAAPQINIDEQKPKRYGYDSSSFSANPTLALDSFLDDVLESLPVDLMSGETDPTAPTMPQQPLHPALLPKAAMHEQFERRTNPFWCDVGDKTFLGTSGQPLDDVFKYLDSEDRLGMAERMLEWSHIAPTCPDTLWCYPFVDRDPFILQQTPHVYFIGNQPRFESSFVTFDNRQQTRVVLVPKFSETGQIVLVHSKTLECKVVEFGMAA
ncbi:DNA polymerase delta small subunit Cdc1 [Microbotryomycetes sp. JL201]|nr:DNA polymerase delta small subunit Cdc1 [Microbotryomycetes sp. JL201]